MKLAGIPSPILLRRGALLLALFLSAPGRGLDASTAAGTAGSSFQLPKNRDAFFVEDDLCYRRFLELMRDGKYRQINKDRASCAETDGGTWEQAGGFVRLHSAHHALRFRALLSGPLCVVLDSGEKIDALPTLARAIRSFSLSTEDQVFTAQSVSEFAAPPAIVAVDPSAETFGRNDLESLLRQIEDTSASEKTGIYTLAAQKIGGTPVLIQRDAVFQAGDVERVRRQYRVAPGSVPPFYFALVGALDFAREVGAWEPFRFVGGIE